MSFDVFTEETRKYCFKFGGCKVCLQMILHWHLTLRKGCKSKKEELVV